MIVLENISKDFEGTAVIKNITLQFPSASATVLIGPSGCGKSTLIRMITGLINPDSGVIKINGSKVDAANLREIRKNLGYVIQEGGLFPHLTAFDNLALMPKYLKWEAEKIIERIDILRELTNLDSNLLNKYPLQLSGGQRQRISLIRALMLDPEILLLDEPLGALDPLIRYDLQSELKEIFQKLSKTVVMVTHDLAEAVYFGDKIVLMKSGEIVQEDSPEDIINKPQSEFVNKFVNAQRSHLYIK